MSNQKISQFIEHSYATNLLIPAVDLTADTGRQNGSITAGTLIAAASSSGGSTPRVFSPSDGLTVTANGTLDSQIFTPNADDTDLIMLSLEMVSANIASPVYNFQLYAGRPTSGGVLVYDFFVDTGTNVGDNGLVAYEHPKNEYFAASSGSNQLWIRLINTQIIPMTIGLRVVVLEYLGNAPTLPVYTPPPPYTGPLLSDVFVGPTRTFTEPRYALAALADGGTMHIDSGIYYLPFGVTDVTGEIPATFGYNAVSGLGTGRFVNGITIVGSGTYNATPTIFNGRGGFGLGPAHPYRLVHGQGFLYVTTNLTISDVLFINCGGNDEFADGEAGIYCNNCTTIPKIVHVLRCAFDANENGIFAQSWHSSTPGETDISNATGPNRYLTLNVELCDFSYVASNGGSGDGHAHDMYVECMHVNVLNSHYYATTAPLQYRALNTVQGFGAPPGPTDGGNCLKSRGRYTSVDGCWIRNQSGKLIDIPEGGALTVNNTIFSSLDGANSLQMGYNTEQTYLSVLSSPLFTNCTLYAKRHNAVFWIVAPGHTFDFENLTQYWCNASATLLPNRDNSGYGGDQTVAPNLIMAPPDNTAFVDNPAAPTPASCATGCVVSPTNP